MILIGNVFFIILCLFFGSTTNFCSDTEIRRENRITNSLCWGASGDSLGAPVEFIQDINEILEKPGYSSDFLVDNYESVIKATQNFYGHKFDYVPYTDDTRMSLLVLQELWNVYKVKDDYESDEKMHENTILRIAQAFKRDSKNHEFGWIAKNRAPGISTMNAIKNIPNNPGSVNDVLLPQLTFENPENNKIGGGCGSVMHAAPFGYFEGFWHYSGEHSKITHNHPIAISSCVSLARGINLIIHGTYKKKEVIQEMIVAAYAYEQESVCQDDINDGHYELRMRRILETAINASKKMKAIRKRFWTGKKMSEYLISFHDLMKNDEFREEHINMFPYRQWEVEDYSYDKPYFSGWDAATCLAAALYNFHLWIPEYIDELNEQERARCLTNAITSAMIISGDSDSVASLTGQLCGAYASKLTVPSHLMHILEDRDKIMQLIEGKAVDLFDHADKYQVNTKFSLLRKVLTKKGLCYTGISLAITSILSWLFYNKVYLNYYSKK